MGQLQPLENTAIPPRVFMCIATRCMNVKGHIDVPVNILCTCNKGLLQVDIIGHWYALVKSFVIVYWKNECICFDALIVYPWLSSNIVLSKRDVLLLCIISQSHNLRDLKLPSPIQNSNWVTNCHTYKSNEMTLYSMFIPAPESGCVSLTLILLLDLVFHAHTLSRTPLYHTYCSRICLSCDSLSV